MNPFVPFLRSPFTKGCLLWLLLPLASAQAQFQADSTKQCAVRLAVATQLYESGRILPALDTLDGCESFEDRAKQQAYYRLMILCYLELGQEKEAEAVMKTLQRQFPRYEPSKAVEPMRYIELYQKYRAAPRMVFAADIGPSFTHTRVLKNYTLTGSAQPGYYPKLIDAYNTRLQFEQETLMAEGDTTLKGMTGMDPAFLEDTVETYQGMLGNIGLALRASVGVGLSPQLTLMVHNTLSFVRYDYASAIMQPAAPYQFDSHGILIIGNNPEVLNGDNILNLEEVNPLYRYEFRQSLLNYQPSISLRFAMPKQRFTRLPIRPYAEVSGGVSVLLSMNRQFTTFVTPNNLFAPTASLPEEFAIVREPKVYHKTQPCFGGGAGVYIGKGTIEGTVGISATKWVGNILNTAPTAVSRYDHAYVSQFYHVDDDLTMTSFSVTGGVIFHFAYQVKKVKKYAKK